MKERQVVQKLIEETLKIKKEVITPERILQSHNQESTQSAARKNKKNSSGIIVKGVGDIAVRFSRCCGPLPGDDIIGYITRGRGVSIHRKDCVNIHHMPEGERERLIDAEWLREQEVEKRTYVTEIQITCLDRLGIIVDISKILTDMKLPVKSFNAKAIKSNAVFNVKIEITNIYQLEELTRKIEQLRDVLEIIRVSS